MGHYFSVMAGLVPAIHVLAIRKKVMPGRSRPKDGVASARLCPGIHDFLSSSQDVDGRDKPGHDDVLALATIMPQ
jgi:hypothetical protein